MGTKDQGGEGKNGNDSGGAINDSMDNNTRERTAVNQDVHGGWMDGWFRQVKVEVDLWPLLRSF